MGGAGSASISSVPTSHLWTFVKLQIMDVERRRLLSDSTGSAVSPQDSRSLGGADVRLQTYPPLTDRAESETDMSALPDLPGSAATVEQEDVHSLRSHGSSVSTMTDDQAALLRKDRIERAPQLQSAEGSRRIKSATSSSQRRKRTHPLGKE